jgi:uncharacterized membrane protein YbhN (UPF0104 family)
MLLPYALLVAAILYLAYEFKGLKFAELLRELRGRSYTSILWACGLVVTNFLVFACYDLVSLRQMKARVPLGVVIKTSALSFSLTNLLGHSMITGLGIRIREYTRYGLTLRQVTGIVVQNVESWWAGFLFLLGVFYVAEGRILGLGLLLAILIYLAASWSFAGRTIVFKKFALHLPDLLGATLKVAVASLDVLITGLTLYVLLPSVVLPLQRFFYYYLSAQLGGTLSGVPGGLGVTEALLLGFFKSHHHAVSLLATFLLYRLIHYIAPATITVAFELGRLIHRSSSKLTVRRSHETSSSNLQRSRPTSSRRL